MPLSPSREAVQAAFVLAEKRMLVQDRTDWGHEQTRKTLAVLGAAMYAIDVAPLVDALRPFAEAADNPNLVLGEAWYRARAVLARSQEPQNG